MTQTQLKMRKQKDKIILHSQPATKKELFKSMMQEFKPSGRKENSKPLASQGTDNNGKQITY